MYLKVQIPARFTLLTSDTDPTPVEMGVIGNSSNQFTIMGLDSLNAPWVQYDKNNDHVYRPDYFSNTLPLFRGDGKVDFETTLAASKCRPFSLQTTKSLLGSSL